MNALRTVNLLNSIIPISRFNKGEANKIFSDVKKYGTRIVVKNNVPECVLVSPSDYQEMMEQYENALLMTEAQKRLSENDEKIPHEEILKEFNLTQSDLEDIEVDLE